MLLGIGGVRALRTYSRITGAPAPEVFHTNEGHAGFLGSSASASSSMTAGYRSTRALGGHAAGTVFIHPHAGARRHRPFSRDLISQHFGGDNACPGVPSSGFLGARRRDLPRGDPGCSTWRVMGLRLAQRANGVSVLHGAVSRGMFAGLWPGFDNDDVPITSINQRRARADVGAPEVFALAEDEVGPELTEEAHGWQRIGGISDGDIWAAAPRAARANLVDEVRRRLSASWLERGRERGRARLGADGARPRRPDDRLRPPGAVVQAADAHAARPGPPQGAAAAPAAPVQLIVAGQVAPRPTTAARSSSRTSSVHRRPGVRHRIVFLPNYDIAMAQLLYPGCDVWLNNPLRPLEACGTSG
jgi:starch phosphorylase